MTQVIATEPAEGLAKMITVIVTVFEEAGLTVSEKQTETMLLQPRDLASRAPPFVKETARQRYK